MEKGKLAKWLKKEGDKVKSGDVLAEIETDKATMEVEAVDEGTLGKIMVPAGTEDVLVNTLIAVIVGEGEKLGDVSAAAPAAKAAAAPAVASAPTPASLHRLPRLRRLHRPVERASSCRRLPVVWRRRRASISRPSPVPVLMDVSVSRDVGRQNPVPRHRRPSLPPGDGRAALGRCGAQALRTRLL